VKNPKEYLEKWSAYKVFPSRELSHIIKQAQIDAYNEALDDAVDDVNFVETTGKPEIYNESPSMSNDMGDVFSIDKQSILKLKK